MRRFILGAAFALAILPPGGAALGQDLAAPAVGRISGRIIDAATGAGISDVAIQVVGTLLGSHSGVDGRFTIQRVPAGPVELSVRRIGLAPKTVTGLTLEGGKVLEQVIAMESAAFQLQAQVVTASAERGTVSEALDAQRSAVSIVNAITAEQISKSSDGDAAQAMQRVSGISVEGGQFPNVRGIGVRYTASSLNGTRIPSPEPEKKVVPLDLFPSSLIQSVTASKTFTPDQPGDFSGASVNIQTREFFGRRLATFSSSAGFGTAVTGRMLLAPTSVLGDYLAMGGGERALPAPVAAAGRFDPQPTPDDVNRIVESFRNSWAPGNRRGAGNGSLGFSLGGNDPVAGKMVSYLFSGTYSYSEEARQNLRRALALPGPTGAAEEVDRYDGEYSRASVLWGGIFNASTTIGTHTRLAFNNTYNRTMDNDARVESGYSQNLQTPLDITRLRYIERSVYATQLALTHQLSQSQRLEYSIAASGVTRKEPDRSEIVYERAESDPTGTARWLSGSNEGAVRTFGDLRESSVEAKGDYRWEFGAEQRRTLRVGALYRSIDRDAVNRSYSIAATGLTPEQRAMRPSEIFDGRFVNDGARVFRVTPLFVGGSYTAGDRLAAGYAMIETPMGSRFSLVTGARVEHSRVTVASEPTVGAVSRTTPTYTDVLPSAALTMKLGDARNLRLAVSQTLARPEYRELSPVQYREVIGFDNVIGNENLVRTLVQNYDVRWEWFPTSQEVLSVSVFGKRFSNPIERVYLGTSGTRVITFQNATAATNYGIELEGRALLGRFHHKLDAYSLFTNATLMNSRIELDAARASVSNANRPMVGQAPYVLNTGLTWTSMTGRGSATVLYNVVGERIQDAGEAPLPDVVERPRHSLDLAVRVPVMESLSLRFDAKNVLDTPYTLTQGRVVREYYTTGRIFSFGLSWKN